MLNKNTFVLFNEYISIIILYISINDSVDENDVVIK